MSHGIDIPNSGTIIPKLGIIMTTTSSLSEFESGQGDPATSRTTLADALFTSTQQKVLGLLFGQPHRSFFVTQIMELAMSGRGSVQRELQRLESAGLVSVQMHGNQKHYQANRKSPLFEELCSIVQKTVGLEEPLMAAVRSLPGTVELALIYGSVAKRADTSESDIDLLIVAEDITLEDVYAGLSPTERLLDRKVSPTLYTSEEFKRRRARGNSFLKRVLDGPTITLVGSIIGE
jgi:predicted nucleotidyltransferase